LSKTNDFLFKNLKHSSLISQRAVVNSIPVRPRPQALQEIFPLLVPQFKTYQKKNSTEHAQHRSQSKHGPSSGVSFQR